MLGMTRKELTERMDHSEFLAWKGLAEVRAERRKKEEREAKQKRGR
jgi:hypothetical protein